MKKELLTGSIQTPPGKPAASAVKVLVRTGNIWRRLAVAEAKVPAELKDTILFHFNKIARYGIPSMKFAEARHLCDSYRFLEGELLCKAGCQRYYIRCVAVSPFDKLNKWIFTQFYLESGDADESLNFILFQISTLFLSAMNQAVGRWSIKIFPFTSRSRSA